VYLPVSHAYNHLDLWLLQATIEVAHAEKESSDLILNRLSQEVGGLRDFKLNWTKRLSPTGQQEKAVELRRTYMAAVNAKCVVRNLAGIEQLCQSAGWEEEWFRVQGLASSTNQRRGIKRAVGEEPGGEKTRQQTTKETQIAATWFGQLEASMNTSIQGKAVGGMIAGLPGKSRDLLHQMGTIASKSTVDKQNSFMVKNYCSLVEEKISRDCKDMLDELILKPELSNSSKLMIIAWADDFNRFGRKQSGTLWDSKSSVFWTMVATKSFVLPDGAGAVGNARAPAFSHLNPAGFSGSTIDMLLGLGGPGKESCLVYSARVLPGGLQHTTFSTAATRNRIASVNYAEATYQEQLRAFNGANLIDILEQNFRSYGEMGRAILRLMSCKALHDVAAAGFQIVVVGDWYGNWFF